MRNIGIISSLENDTYQLLKEIECNVFKFFIEDIKKINCDMDICIIDTDNTENLYELILLVREVFTGLLWVVYKNNSDEERLNESLCYRLGVNGISNFDLEKTDFVLQMKNFMGLSIGKNKQKSINSEKKSFILEPKNLTVLKNDKEVYLTRLEFIFLDLLLNNRGKAVSYEEIYQYLWPNKSEYNYNIQVRISNLVFLVRKKIENDPKKPIFIKTIRSIGYMFEL